MSRTALRFIKKADPACLKRIITLYKNEGWWSPGDNPRGLRRLIAGSHCFLLAERDGELAGMGRAVSDGVSDAYLQDIVVAAGQRGRGLGSALVKALVRRLKADGINWIGLIAQGGSAPLYSKHGFSEFKSAVPMLYKGSRV